MLFRSELPLPDGSSLTLEPLLRTKRRLGLKNFDPCTILLNTDLAGGVPEVLTGLHEQYLLPPLHAGWSVRRKARHLEAYEEVAKKFAKLLGMDPWLINPMHAHCSAIDWRDPQGLETVRAQVDALLTKVRRKHKEYGITEKPYVVVKADNGGHDMGIVSLRDAKDLDELAGRLRLPPDGASGPQALSEVLIQEGVPTYERVNDAVAEDRKSTRLNSSHSQQSRMPSSA